MTIYFPNLNFRVVDVPQGFRIFGFPFSMFGVLLAAGIVLGVIVTLFRAQRRNVNPNHCLGMIIFSLIGGVLGGRALYVACYWEMFRDDVMKILDIRGGGMAFYGSLFGGIFFGLLYCAFAGQSFLELADTITPGLVLGQAVARWGDFFMLQSFGEYTSSPLAMQLPLSAVRSAEVTDTMREKLVTIGGVSYIQASPVFLYESAACLLLFFFLLGKNPRKTFTGGIFFRYLMWYGLIRALVEWFRTDQLKVPGFPYGISFIISAGLFVLFTLVVLIENDMYKKRSALRRERIERHYQEDGQQDLTMDEEERQEVIRAIGEERMRQEEGKKAAADTGKIQS